MKFNKYKISHYFIFIISGINYLIAIIFKFFIRNKNNNILLYGHKLTGNLEVIFKDSRFNKHNTLYITLNFKDYIKLKKEFGKRILSPLSVLQIIKALSSKLIITSHGIFLHKAIKILGIKTIWCGHAIVGALPKNTVKNYRIFEKFNQVLLHSPYDYEIHKNELKCKVNNLHTVGFIRNQLMLENSNKKEELKIRNGLSKNKVILYAPTSNRGSKKYINSEFSIFNLKFHDFIKNELFNSDTVLVIKTHINDSLSENIRKLIGENRNVFLDEDIDLDYDYDLLIMSDVLITDLSTIYVDYLLLDKPIYLIENPDPDPKRELTSILKNINLPKIKNKKDFKLFIQKNKNNELDYVSIKELKNKVYGDQDHLKSIPKLNNLFSLN